MGWNEIDDKVKKKLDRSFVLCDEEYELNVIEDVIEEEFPKIPNEEIVKAISRCCNKVSAPRPRQKFIQCVKNILSLEENIMRKLSFSIVILAVCIICLSSCSKSGAPNCSDSDVKASVIDISTGELKNQLLSQAIITQLGMAPQLQGNPTYEQWNQLKDKDENIKKIIDYVDKQVAEMGMTLTGIRTNGKNDEIKKCQCGGNLAFSNGKSFSIEYTAQYTEDGQIYVEVSGLK